MGWLGKVFGCWLHGVFRRFFGMVVIAMGVCAAAGIYGVDVCARCVHDGYLCGKARDFNATCPSALTLCAYLRALSL